MTPLQERAAAFLKTRIPAPQVPTSAPKTHQPPAAVAPVAPTMPATSSPKPTSAPTAPSGSRTARRVAAGQQTIQRAQDSESPANDAQVIAGFAAMGIPTSEIKPRENVFTFNAWIAQGRAVNKGAHGVKLTTYRDLPPKTDTETGEVEEMGGRKRTSATVFHISQTHLLDDTQQPTTTTPPNPPAAPTQAPQPTSKPGNGSKIAASLRAKAEALTPQIEAKMSPATAGQRPTARRMNIVESMRQDGKRLQEQQRALNALADAHERGDIAPELATLKTRADVETALYRDTPTRQLLRALMETTTTPAQVEEANRPAQIRLAENALLGRKIPGFFPTPPELAERIIHEAEVSWGDLVLEPSAGTGRLATAAREADAEVDVDCYEVNSDLCHILELKGFTPTRANFLEVEPEPKYNAVVMNPPFENGQDAEHIQHAYRFLMPGGRLVAIAGEGIFFRSDRKATQFREWLQSLGGTSEKLPPNSFHMSGTGVNTRLVIVDKPAQL